jgi:5,10-methylenetetrahydromethanopterin reductase
LVTFGVGSSPVESLRKMIWLAKTAELLGFKYFVHADQRFRGERDVYVTLTSEALNTSEIMLGPCISDPYSRIPGLQATAIATLDEASHGRALLTLGAGGAAFKELHLDRKSPNTAIREAFYIIKHLLQGEEVTFKGQMFNVTKGRTNLQTRKDIPIFIASRSPSNLELAGEIADGAVIAFASPQLLKHALEKIESGARKAKRSLNDLKLIAWVYTAVTPDSRQAVDNVRPFVTQALLNTSPDMYPAMFAGLKEDVTSFLLACRKNGTEQAAYEDRKYMTDDVVRRFSIAGTPQECVEKLSDIVRLGIQTIWLRCFSAPHAEVNHERVLIPFAEQVMPHVK